VAAKPVPPNLGWMFRVEEDIIASILDVTPLIVPTSYWARPWSAVDNRPNPALYTVP
jgi:hypothetical protein